VSTLLSPTPAPVNETTRPGLTEKLITLLLVVGPVLALAWAAGRTWNHRVGWLDVSLLVGLYLVTGFGISLGFHRLFTHHSFRARRWLRITLAVAGSMAAEGSVITWVAHHRRHHVYADKPGDPHSPTPQGEGLGAQLRGLGHAHVGWLFSGTPPNAEKWSRDLLADRDMVVVAALTPVWTVLSLLLPFAIGWAVTGTIAGALLALLWGGAVRIALLHHVTWGVNSLGHTFGAHPYATKDRSGNIGLLAVLSFGDSWHNSHHAFPALARHGFDRGQLDASARLLAVFEGLGWASQSRLATPEQRATRRVP
jgi:stearoyl-CoA desaturase (delta-9 desaturase)